MCLSSGQCMGAEVLRVTDCKVLPLKDKVDCPCSPLISTLIGWVAAWRQALLDHTGKNNLLHVKELQDRMT